MTKRILGIDRPIADEEGTTRIVAQGEWLAVAFLRDRTKALIESIDRSEVMRSFAVIPGQDRRYDVAIVASLDIYSSVGRFRWEAVHGNLTRIDQVPILPTNPFMTTVPGTLWLPDGTPRSTERGSGFFDISNSVHAYEAWRDAELKGGWKAIVEVDRSAPAEWRPILAALPMLLFTSPML